MSSDFKKNVACLPERLRTAREQVGLSQAALARRLSIGRPTLVQYESGHICPSVPVLIALADALAVSLDWLTGRTDDPPKGGESDESD
ncbi:helix-turn-helix domain-containing protein [Sulfobacillus harzensis]|uniref:Helix-turn-helix transcriptional regulator n=1 Tax=Sulfobacillus harzensis TaxID=2729629 RepID=A0A7Y0L354_9FIRM|nr:helix-turn-helix transcriptional regulator [Sulfobacillus harzensis]NMP21866.1 helix-turn-helix transcriptional regulator [Sulfobacillus harzensis]